MFLSIGLGPWKSSSALFLIFLWECPASFKTFFHVCMAGGRFFGKNDAIHGGPALFAWQPSRNLSLGWKFHEEGRSQQIPAWLVTVSHPLWRSTSLGNQETQSCPPVLSSFTSHHSKPALRCPCTRKTSGEHCIPRDPGASPSGECCIFFPLCSTFAGKGNSRFSLAGTLSRVWKRLPCSKMHLGGGEGPICPEFHSWGVPS